jgi:hypothetical protein
LRPDRSLFDDWSIAHLDHYEIPPKQLETVFTHRAQNPGTNH